MFTQINTDGEKIGGLDCLTSVPVLILDNCNVKRLKTQDKKKEKYKY